MDLLEGLDYVYSLSLQKKEYEQQKIQLEQKLEQPIPLEQMQEVQKVSLDKKLMVFVFAIIELVLMNYATKTISRVLTLMANDWKTEEEVYASGMICYYNMEVGWPVGAIVAIPFALLVTFLICIVVKQIKKGKNSQLRKQNKMNSEENERIIKQNERIAEQNKQYQNQIAKINDLLMQLVHTLKENVSWYPEEYFFTEAVDYIKKEIQSGRAASVTEAVVHFEAAREQ